MSSVAVSQKRSFPTNSLVSGSKKRKQTNVKSIEQPDQGLLNDLSAVDLDNDDHCAMLHSTAPDLPRWTNIPPRDSQAEAKVEATVAEPKRIGYSQAVRVLHMLDMLNVAVHELLAAIDCIEKSTRDVERALEIKTGLFPAFIQNLRTGCQGILPAQKERLAMLNQISGEI
ncbi:uncharacterized protein B0J16DRAFT_323339 [Fusarium flagelliforme]|uniref:uncharacterized protein n=1 Tax=Fusarium flagelliforme TaxID=2675880 RepID=UPI001E8D695D|nr:uncharacterized protein B0J16DRAFT_323339 [Fusarium flagelliforme]KAH7179866.1 hypothetical protein B0J16DRAFT_323339 [Fusarium flagelliforme]